MSYASTRRSTHAREARRGDPGRDPSLYDLKWDGASGRIVFRGRLRGLHPERDLRPLDRYFPELHAALHRAAARRAASSTARFVIATARGLDSRRCNCGCTRRPRAPRSWRRRRRRRSSPSTPWRSVDGILRAVAQSERRAPARAGARRRRAAGAPDADDARSAVAATGCSLRGRGPRRRDRQAVDGTYEPASAR
jgi:hypothetical protein